jgi:tRNA G10  N-methylase Trm11
VTLNKVKFEVTENNDLIITGFRFLEVDGDLYFLDLKNKEAINKIKTQYFDNKIEHSHLSDTEFIRLTEDTINKSYAKTVKTL